MYCIEKLRLQAIIEQERAALNVNSFKTDSLSSDGFLSFIDDVTAVTKGPATTFS